MPDRHTIDTITSDALDALYEQLEAAEQLRKRFAYRLAAIQRVRDAATLHRQGLLRLSELYAVIAAALDPQEQP